MNHLEGRNGRDDCRWWCVLAVGCWIASVAVEIVLASPVLLSFFLLLTHDALELPVLGLGSSSIIDSLYQTNNPRIGSVIIVERAQSICSRPTLAVNGFLYSLLDNAIRLVQIDQRQSIRTKSRARSSCHLCLRSCLGCWGCWSRDIGGHRDRGLLELENPLPIVLRTNTLPRHALPCTGRLLRCLWRALRLCDRLD